MRKIAEVVSHELKWAQPSMTRREYQLTAAGEPIGSLGFRSMFGTHATTEGADGSLTFKRVGAKRRNPAPRERHRVSRDFQHLADQVRLSGRQ